MTRDRILHGGVPCKRQLIEGIRDDSNDAYVDRAQPCSFEYFSQSNLFDRYCALSLVYTIPVRGVNAG
jgi:hypothetical protein